MRVWLPSDYWRGRRQKEHCQLILLRNIDDWGVGSDAMRVTPSAPADLHLGTVTWQPAAEMKGTAMTVCVSTIPCGCGSKSYLLQVCSKLNLQVQKAKRALSLVLPLVLYARQVFLRVFLVLKAFPLPPSLSQGAPPGLSTLDPRRQKNAIRHSLRTLRTQHSNMIPLVPTLALAFLSFTCSVFVILRIVIPILPPHPLSRRVAPVRIHPTTSGCGC